MKKTITTIAAAIAVAWWTSAQETADETLMRIRHT